MKQNLKSRKDNPPLLFLRGRPLFRDVHYPLDELLYVHGWVSKYRNETVQRYVPRSEVQLRYLVDQHSDEGFQRIVNYLVGDVISTDRGLQRCLQNLETYEVDLKEFVSA